VHELLEKLTGGDRRSIGRSGEVAAEVLRDPGLFPVLVDGMLSDDPLIRMRAADAAEKVTRERPDLLVSQKGRLLRDVASIPQQEVRWHAAPMFSRLRLTPRERRLVFSILRGYLEDKSRIVKTASMEALAGLAEQDRELRPRILEILEELTERGSPAMKSRGRKLLARLKPG
jgi:hypothetical protein